MVGGAVRDMLLGKIPKDLDYVVVGSSEAEMLNHGFKKVGAAFPVFLSENGSEYALARTEKKSLTTGTNAHAEFDFETNSVSLQEDLQRRDLTINAMAFDVESNTLIDYVNGKTDLENKTLRHVSPAFSEDPLRVFRVARFAARLGFSVAPETLTLMRQVVAAAEFKTLSFERVCVEMEGALQTEKPSIFFEVLKSVGGLDHYFPELVNLFDVPQKVEYHPEGDVWVHTMLVLDQAANLSPDIRIRFAALVHDLGKGITPQDKLPAHPGHESSGIPLVEQFCDRLHIPNSWREAAIVVTRNHLRVHQIDQAKASSIVRMFYEFNAFKKPELVAILARACEADDLGKNRVAVTQGHTLEEYFQVANSIGFKDIKSGLQGQAISNEIRAERVRHLKTYMEAKTK